ncbi:helix-turn-helix domain-containing protein, partial [Carnobacterium maltaromaticum]
LEYKMMGLLMKKTNSVIGYEAISKDIWGGSLNDDRQFKTANLIFNLRTKLKKNAIDASIIKTVRTKGYQLKLK